MPVDQAASRFLRQPRRSNAPRPVAKSGRAAGSGVVRGTDAISTFPLSGSEAVAVPRSICPDFVIAATGCVDEQPPKNAAITRTLVMLVNMLCPPTSASLEGSHCHSRSIHALAVVHLWIDPHFGHFTSNVNPSRDRNTTASVCKPVSMGLPIAGQRITILGTPLFLPAIIDPRSRSADRHRSKHQRPCKQVIHCCAKELPTRRPRT